MVARSQLGVEDTTIRLWDVETGEHISALTGHTGWVSSVSFSPDGRTLATGSEDATVRLWDVETGEHISALTGHTDGVSSVSFSPDGRTLASGSWDDDRAVVGCGDGRSYQHAHKAYGLGLEVFLLVRMAARSQVGVGTAPSVCGMRRRAIISARSQGIRMGS